jgi:hypothetical protein
MYSKHARVVVPIKGYIDLKTNATGGYSRARILSDIRTNNKPFTAIIAQQG